MFLISKLHGGDDGSITIHTPDGRIFADGTLPYTMWARLLFVYEFLNDVCFQYGYYLDAMIMDESSMALTLGVGGSIKQAIYRDGNDPRIWDMGSAKRIHIRLVNAAVFEFMTGMATPPTPASSKTYMSSYQCICYDIYREEPNSVSDSTAFGKLKSTSQIDAETEPEIETETVGFRRFKTPALWPRLLPQLRKPRAGDDERTTVETYMSLVLETDRQNGRAGGTHGVTRG
ncbi:hypothetical protein EJ06DRAFT_522924 [Trichodelitschia bisporula]|uniref:Uncharacterized protein n=1 Tax=Trichodelitschia bisporula TaxID=703511 RepID=A0A6G1HRQ6_9PEZI|nr:hypothetical protein EJ06DRAFT_522924 [Trichodelitschia bisporula]